MRLSAALVCLAALAVSVLAAPYWSLSGSYEPTCENWRTVKAAYDDIMSHDAVKHRVRNNYKITSVRSISTVLKRYFCVPVSYSHNRTFGMSRRWRHASHAPTLPRLFLPL
jgi:hypothetical protein